jgi:hypothetical protein
MRYLRSSKSSSNCDYRRANKQKDIRWANQQSRFWKSSSKASKQIPILNLRQRRLQSACCKL